MIGLLQRVQTARVEIGEKEVARIGQGLLVFVGIEQDDSEATSDRLLDRILAYRVFPDSEGRMNLSVRDIEAGLLLVPQFTLVADTGAGTRPGFSRAAKPEHARIIFEKLTASAQSRYPRVQAGQFGVDMLVSLANDGPATFWLQVTG